MNKTLIYAAVLICGMALGYGLVSFFNTDQSDTIDEQLTPTIWTCSMHPEIKQEEPGICPICNMDLTPMDEDMETGDANRFQLSENALALANVQTHFITNDNEMGSQTFTGRIEATDAGLKVQSAYVSGRVEKLFVNTTGESVRKGQILASIYSPELISTQQELLSAWNRKDKNPALYKAVYNKLLQWKWSEAQIQKLIDTKEILSSFPIRAMVSGEIISKNISEGAYISQGESLFEIIDLQSVWGVIEISENQASQIAVGDEVTLNTSSQRDLKGKVDFIHPLVNPSTRTIQIRIEIPNQDRSLKPGMLLTAHLAGKDSIDNEKIYLPKSAVLWTGKRSIIYIAHKENKTTQFEMREVLLGNRFDENYEVLQGVELGEEVVIHGAFTIDAAAQLQGRNSMMNREEITEVVLSDSEQEKLLEFMKYYFELKDAFVSSDVKIVAEYANSKADFIKTLNISLDESSQKLWNTIEKQWQNIAMEHQAIDKQRKSFKTLNEHLLPIAQQIDTQHPTWYVQECPMADNDTGGHWLSLEKQVVNPYFGNLMLHCGAVEQIL